MAAKYTDAAAARNHGATPTIRDKVLIAAMTRACGGIDITSPYFVFLIAGVV
jgi:hypothetical protein